MEPQSAPCASTHRVIAIGDIHGCIHALEALLEVIKPTPRDQVVVLGDFIDVGRDTRDVIDRLIALENECRLVAILGNHEEMLLNAIENPKFVPQWLDSGGIYTIHSYRYLGGLDAIIPEHVDFIRRAKPWHETDGCFFTHANYDPELPLPEQPEYLLRWAVLEPPYPGPHVSGKTAVVGHTEQKSGEILDLGYLKCIDTYCHGYGWLSALEVSTGTLWQAGRFGVLRQAGETLEGQRQAKAWLHASVEATRNGNDPSA